MDVPFMTCDNCGLVFGRMQERGPLYYTTRAIGFAASRRGWTCYSQDGDRLDFCPDCGSDAVDDMAYGAERDARRMLSYNLMLEKIQSEATMPNGKATSYA